MLTKGHPWPGVSSENQTYSVRRVSLASALSCGIEQRGDRVVPRSGHPELRPAFLVFMWSITFDRANIVDAFGQTAKALSSIRVDQNPKNRHHGARSIASSWCFPVGNRLTATRSCRSMYSRRMSRSRACRQFENQNLLATGMTPFVRMTLPYLRVSPVCTIAKAFVDRVRKLCRSIRAMGGVSGQ